MMHVEKQRYRHELSHQIHTIMHNTNMPKNEDSNWSLSFGGVFRCQVKNMATSSQRTRQQQETENNELEFSQNSNEGNL